MDAQFIVSVLAAGIVLAVCWLFLCSVAQRGQEDDALSHLRLERKRDLLDEELARYERSVRSRRRELRHARGSGQLDADQDATDDED